MSLFLSLSLLCHSPQTLSERALSPPVTFLPPYLDPTSCICQSHLSPSLHCLCLSLCPPSLCPVSLSPPLFNLYLPFSLPLSMPLFPPLSLSHTLLFLSLYLSLLFHTLLFLSALLSLSTGFTYFPLCFLTSSLFSGVMTSNPWDPSEAVFCSTEDTVTMECSPEEPIRIRGAHELLDCEPWGTTTRAAPADSEAARAHARSLDATCASSTDPTQRTFNRTAIYATPMCPDLRNITSRIVCRQATQFFRRQVKFLFFCDF